MLDGFFIEMYSNKNSGTIRVSFTPGTAGNGNWIVRFSLFILPIISFTARRLRDKLEVCRSKFRLTKAIDIL